MRDHDYLYALDDFQNVLHLRVVEKHDYGGVATYWTKLENADPTENMREAYAAYFKTVKKDDVDTPRSCVYSTEVAAVKSAVAKQLRAYEAARVILKREADHLHKLSDRLTQLLELKRVAQHTRHTSPTEQ